MPPEQECPYCGEFVKAVAKKCRHCGEWLKEERRERGVIGWRGESVVLAVPGELYTAGCAMCGNERATPTQQKFRYVPSWVYLFAFVIGVGVVIVAHVVRKEASMMLAMCKKCKSDWSTSKLVFTLFGFLGLFAVPALFAFVGNTISRRNGIPLGILLGFIAWIVGLVLINFLYVHKKQARCVEITDESMTLKFPQPRLLKRLVKEAKEDC